MGGYHSKWLNVAKDCNGSLAAQAATQSTISVDQLIAELSRTLMSGEPCSQFGQERNFWFNEKPVAGVVFFIGQ